MSLTEHCIYLLRGRRQNMICCSWTERTTDNCDYHDNKKKFKKNAFLSSSCVQWMYTYLPVFFFFCYFFLGIYLTNFANTRNTQRMHILSPAVRMGLGFPSAGISTVTMHQHIIIHPRYTALSVASVAFLLRHELICCDMASLIKGCGKP